ncbi:PAS domain S-box protein [Archaeoglobus neptunius]|uniref:PAS domain S-box protein n=1 Tax=Archaeoglobus neptunius TaxID=2798580 RepID=UPI001928EC22|nr:PAS domain S-box protein [Archaeoglobus neptunius]
MSVGDEDFRILKSVLDSFPFYVILVDEEHKIVLANRKFEELFPDAIGHYCPGVVHGTDSPVPECPLEEAVERGLDALEKEVYDPEHDRWFISAVYRVDLSYRGKRLYCHFLVDITERKRYRERLERINELLLKINEVNRHIVNAEDIESLVSAAVKNLREIFSGVRLRVQFGNDEWVKTEGELRNPTKVTSTYGKLLAEIMVCPEISDQEKEILRTFLCNLCIALEKIKLDEERKRAFESIEKNVYQMAVLTDHIRNPLASIALLAEDTEVGERILKEVDRINEVLRKLDEGWIESEKIREYLKKSWK